MNEAKTRQNILINYITPSDGVPYNNTQLDAINENSE